jgi:hypothetical protein
MRGQMTGKIARMPVDAYLDTPNSVSLSLSRQAYQEEVSKCKRWRRKKDSRTKFEDPSNHESLGKESVRKKEFQTPTQMMITTILQLHKSSSI